MAFFKTLEQQAEDSGFVCIAVVRTFGDSEEVFCEPTGKEVGRAIQEYVTNNKKSVDDVYLRVRKVSKSPGQCNCEQCLRGYHVLVFIPK